MSGERLQSGFLPSWIFLYADLMLLHQFANDGFLDLFRVALQCPNSSLNLRSCLHQPSKRSDLDWVVIFFILLVFFLFCGAEASWLLGFLLSPEVGAQPDFVLVYYYRVWTNKVFLCRVLVLSFHLHRVHELFQWFDCVTMSIAHLCVTQHDEFEKMGVQRWKKHVENMIVCTSHSIVVHYTTRSRLLAHKKDEKWHLHYFQVIRSGELKGRTSCYTCSNE